MAGLSSPLAVAECRKQHACQLTWGAHCACPGLPARSTPSLLMAPLSRGTFPFLLLNGGWGASLPLHSRPLCEPVTTYTGLHERSHTQKPTTKQKNAQPSAERVSSPIDGTVPGVFHIHFRTVSSVAHPGFVV